jgi:hypothetical protein
MAAPKKTASTIDQIVSVLMDMMNEPMTDVSSIPPNAADVKRVRSRMGASRAAKKGATKARARPAAKKEPATSRKKAAVKRVARTKAPVKKRSKKG